MEANCSLQISWNAAKIIIKLLGGVVLPSKNVECKRGWDYEKKRP